MVTSPQAGFPRTSHIYRARNYPYWRNKSPSITLGEHLITDARLETPSGLPLICGSLGYSFLHLPVIPYSTSNLSARLSTPLSEVGWKETT